MPTDTFYRLEQDKQEKIMLAAKKEFSENAIQEASIANIIKYAEIPRGSFYQYFSGKDDIFFYLFTLIKKEPEQEIILLLEKNKGDLFKTFTHFFDYFSKEVFEGPNQELYQNIFQHMNYTRSNRMMTSDMTSDQKKRHEAHLKLHHRDVSDVYLKMKETVDQKELRVENEREFRMLVHQLWSMLFHTINEGFRALACDQRINQEVLQKDYELKLSWLENGVKK